MCRLWPRLSMACSCLFFLCIALDCEGDDDLIANASAIDVYQTIKRINELAISSDGTLLAFVSTTGLTHSEKRPRKLVVLQGREFGQSNELPEFSDATNLEWIPGTHDLAFIHVGPKGKQVHVIDADTRQVRTLTHSSPDIEKFDIAPNGRYIAYTTRQELQSANSDFRSGTVGIVADISTVSVYSFLGKQSTSQGYSSLWVKTGDTKPRKIEIPGNVLRYHWSSDNSMLSIVYSEVAGDARSLYADFRTSIGIVDMRAKVFRPIATTTPAERGKPGVSYEGGEWIPGSREFILRRIIEPALYDPNLRGTDHLVGWHYPDWSAVDAQLGLGDHPKWSSVEAPNGQWIAVSKQEALVETTRRARSVLLQVRTDGSPTERRLREGANGSVSLVRCSDACRTVAFVHQSLTESPELWVTSTAGQSKQITFLNLYAKSKLAVGVRELDWRSKDGTKIHGWLLLPDLRHSRPWPIVTFIHGGPSNPYKDEFAPYFEYWPYPFEIYAQSGIAVFIPNYRGSASFGRRIESPSSLDKEPADDIISGIDILVSSGIADPQRLGIAGHSHGTWLGLLIMARENRFRAAALAEGLANLIVGSELTPLVANEEYLNPILGTDLYQSPMYFAQLSPDLHFKQVSSANLFEAGALSHGVFMIGAAKASRRDGAPTEFVVYPASHNLINPDTQTDSAKRTLEWFLYWLNGNTLATPSRKAQYERWTQLLRSACQNGNPRLACLQQRVDR